MPSLLPVNVTAEKAGVRRPPLALVDDSIVEELRPYNWQTSPSGQVYRLFLHPERDDLGRLVHMRESLAARVLGLQYVAGAKIAYRNGDRLDCRAENLFEPATHEQVMMVVPPGSTFASTPEYAEARRQRAATLHTLAARYPKGRKSRKLTPEQVREFLDDVQTHRLYRDLSLRDLVQEYFVNGLEISITPMHVRAIMLGESLRLPDYDYSPMRARVQLKKLRSQERLDRLSKAASVLEKK